MGNVLCWNSQQMAKKKRKRKRKKRTPATLCHQEESKGFPFLRVGNLWTEQRQYKTALLIAAAAAAAAVHHHTPRHWHRSCTRSRPRLRAPCKSPPWFFYSENSKIRTHTCGEAGTEKSDQTKQGGGEMTLQVGGGE